MLQTTNFKKESVLQYRVSPKAVDEMLNTSEFGIKKTHSKSFYLSLKNRKLSVSNATKTA